MFDICKESTVSRRRGKEEMCLDDLVGRLILLDDGGMAIGIRTTYEGRLVVCSQSPMSSVANFEEIPPFRIESFTVPVVDIKYASPLRRDEYIDLDPEEVKRIKSFFIVNRDSLLFGRHWSTDTTRVQDFSISLNHSLPSHLELKELQIVSDYLSSITDDPIKYTMLVLEAWWGRIPRKYKQVTDDDGKLEIISHFIKSNPTEFNYLINSVASLAKGELVQVNKYPFASLKSGGE